MLPFVTWNREPAVTLVLQKCQENLVKLLQLDLRLKLARAQLQLKMRQHAVKSLG